MKRLALGLVGLGLAIVVAQAAPAADGLLDQDPGIYGKLDLSRFGKPQVLNVKPLLVSTAKGAGKAKPVFVHVRPGWELHWSAHCAAYDACNVPVYFVTEGWFVHVYLPVIGEQDGREQRYLIQKGRDREALRGIHDSRADD